MSIFTIPINKISLDNIKDLIENKERENNKLDYKTELKGNDRDKRELAKDVSAFANSEGGYLIIGIKEEDGVPKTLCGTNKNIGRQKIEEWIENVLIANISQKVSVSIKVLPLPKSDRVVVTVCTPASSRKPHMLTYQGENKYYKRHLFQVLPASESEVREMFESSKRHAEEMSTLLKEKNLINENDNNFGRVRLVSNLTKCFIERQKQSGITSPKESFVTFITCPRWLEEKVNITTTEFDIWIDSKRQGYYPNKHFVLLPHNKTISINSLLLADWCSGEGKQDWLWDYTEIFRNGFIETGVSSKVFWPKDNPPQPLLHLTYLIGLFFVFLGFVKEFYQYIKYYDEITILMCLVNIDGVMLHGFGKRNDKRKWLQPYDMMYGDRKPMCIQKSVKLERVILASELNDLMIKEIAYHFAERIANAFGERIAKCFDDNGNFYEEGFDLHRY